VKDANNHSPRDGFHIHSGDAPGTHGCPEMAPMGPQVAGKHDADEAQDMMDEFFNLLIVHRKSIHVQVDLK